MFTCKRLLTQSVVVIVDNKRKAEMVELDDDENSSSDEEECNIPILYSCQLVKFNTYFRAYS